MDIVFLEKRYLFYVFIVVLVFLAGFSYINFVAIPRELASQEGPYGSINNPYSLEQEQELFKKAETGDPESQFKVSIIYRFGSKYTKIDEAKYFYWTRRSAESGFAKGQYNLGVMYQSGYGVEKNLDTAKYWYGKAKEQNFPLSH